ncbi:MAG: CPBP family intramembrane metalloprotease [Phycisphaerales bacterium]|nr:MAG: CPBP family intramembrane metalloprotease [Phycisphaerales bacterium]
MSADIITLRVSRRTGFQVALAICLSTVYCLAFLASPQDSWPELLQQMSLELTRCVYRAIATVLSSLGASTVSSELGGGLYFLVTAAVIPWLVLALCRRGRPHDLGFRRPNRVGWRILLAGLILALPFIVWMARGEDFAGYYMRRLDRAGAGAFLLYYFVVMLTEHLFFHGLLLGACMPGGRWPDPPPTASDTTGAIRRTLQWIGLAQPTGGATGLRRLTLWLGLPAASLPAVLTSGALFCAVHLGKHPRELLLSLPGGLASAYIAFRSNSWFIPFALHLATSAAACGIMLAAR